MLILGLVNWMQPVHGYDVRRELLTWSADKWGNVQPGSIYHGLRKLTEEGLLREVGTEQVGARPARTSYEITPEGRTEFEHLLRGYWWDVKPGQDPFLAALSFLPAMPREEAVTAMRNRSVRLQAANMSLRLNSESNWFKKPVYAGWLMELMAAKNEAEIAWCDRIATLIESGVSYGPVDADE
jgi:DNA-binding PadR family transcriptional regulator